MKYAIIEKKSIYIPGDERSRTNPGHGYPERYEEYSNIKEFDTEEDLINYLEKWPSRQECRVIKFEELKIKKTLSIYLNDSPK